MYLVTCAEEKTEKKVKVEIKTEGWGEDAKLADKIWTVPQPHTHIILWNM